MTTLNSLLQEPSFTTALIVALAIATTAVILFILVETPLHPDYKSPTTGKLSLPWTTKTILENFSYSAAQRWYESITLCHQNPLISLLSALHLIYVVKITFISMSDDNSGCVKHIYYHGFRSFDTLKRQLIQDEKVNNNYSPGDEDIDDPAYIYDTTLVAGHNVVFSWCHHYLI